ncbi:MAG: site-2 protease family protein [Acidobacteriota bacterium]
MLLYGLLYSVPLLSILLAHEMGHFMACRYYGLRCTPPYFIPIPISIAGTLGAFIKIKSPFRSKRALFDVGIAGPLAGFAVTLPILWIGISLSQIVPKTSESAGMIFFGEPLIFRIISAAIFNYNPNVEDLIAHPVAMAGWFGLLVTSLNLLPVWQLDGGHIAFALLGPRYQKKLSIAALSLLMLVGLYGWPTPSYLIFGLLVFILGYRQRFYHPSPIQSWDSIGKARIALALVSLAILILCFTPVPVSFN